MAEGRRIHVKLGYESKQARIESYHSQNCVQKYPANERKDLGPRVIVKKTKGQTFQVKANTS